MAVPLTICLITIKCVVNIYQSSISLAMVGQSE